MKHTSSKLTAEEIKDWIKAHHPKDSRIEVYGYTIDAVVGFIKHFTDKATEQSEETEDRACPCLYLKKPCHDRCTCINGLSSSGCRNCCTYGSLEQRTRMAEALNAERLSHQTKAETTEGYDAGFPSFGGEQCSWCEGMGCRRCYP